jgi:Dienelactone hydrolase and related enzymes
MTGYVSFHGGFKTLERPDYSETTGSVLILHGSVDPVSGIDDVTNLVKEINDFEIQHEVHIYGGVRHSFTIKGLRGYSENVERKSWNALLSYLKENSNL